MEGEEDQTPSAIDNQQTKPLVLTVLQALKQASHYLQTNPTPNLPDPHSDSSAIEALLDLQNESDSILSDDPQLSTLSNLLTTLKTLIQALHNSRTRFGLRSFLLRRVISHDISSVAISIESEIQSWIDREIIETLTRSSQRHIKDDQLIDAIHRFKDRISLGFDRELQHLVLKSKVFEELESILCDSRFSVSVRQLSAFAIAGLIRFNKDVFVGKVLMSRTIRALISLASLSSLKVLCLLIKSIKSPIVDEIESNAQIPKIICFLSCQDASICHIAIDCVLEVGYLGRKVAIQAMLKEGLIEKLMELQREENVETRHPLMSCVARFAVQVEVGEGMRQREKCLVKQEILKRVKDFSLSDAESASIAAETVGVALCDGAWRNPTTATLGEVIILNEMLMDGVGAKIIVAEPLVAEAKATKAVLLLQCCFD